MLDLESILNQKRMRLKAILETDEYSSAFIVDETTHYLFAPGSILHEQFIYHVLDEGFHILLKSGNPLGSIIAQMPQDWRESQGAQYPIITDTDTTEYLPGQRLDPTSFKMMATKGYSILIDPNGGTQSTQGEGSLSFFKKNI
jgi:hypothetical protein